MDFYVKVKSTCENCGFHGLLMRGSDSPIEHYCSKTYPASKIPEGKTCSNFVYNSNLLRPLVVGDVLIKEEEEKPKDTCTGHICGICDKFSILRADGEQYQYTCTAYNKTIPAIGAVRDIRPKDFRD